MTQTELTDSIELEEQVEKSESKRRALLVLFVFLLVATCYSGYLFVRYLNKPEPLPNLLPVAVAQGFRYPPTYKYSITGVDSPMGVAYSPSRQVIYVTEAGGERWVKMFDLKGNLLGSFAAPGTDRSNRKPAYVAVDAQGRVYVSEHYNGVINIFSAEGEYLDSIIDRKIRLSRYVAEQTRLTLPAGTEYFYNNIDKQVYYQLPGREIQSIPGPSRSTWTPLGLRFDRSGNLLITNLAGGKHAVLIYPAAALADTFMGDFELLEFGLQGQGDGEFSFPNSAVTDSRGNYYISDGNNGRISLWSGDIHYQMFFGFGSSESAFNLPRGAWMDNKDRLHVADAVGHFIRVFDVSTTPPTFLYNFGGFGDGDSSFNYPTDIVIDETGRLFITDRENNRIQVWTY